MKAQIRRHGRGVILVEAVDGEKAAKQYGCNHTVAEVGSRSRPDVIHLSGKPHCFFEPMLNLVDTIPFALGAAATIFGFSFFGFFASRLPCRSPLLIVPSSSASLAQSNWRRYLMGRASGARQLFVAVFASSVSIPDAQALANE